MSFEKIKAERASAANFMVDEITHICKTFGKRDPGSEGEKKAVEYMAEKIKEYGVKPEDIKIEPFDVYPASFMGWIYISISLFLLSMVAYFFMPILTLVLIVVGMVFMFAQFIFYRRFIDKLFAKKTSYNLTAIKRCTGECKRRLFYNGHPDAAFEWTMNYHFGGVGFIGHFVAAVVGILYLTAIAIAKIIKPELEIANLLGYICLAFVPFWIGMYFLWNEKIVVDGANDNLTGCYMGISVLKALYENGIELENTEVGLLISGSEEAGLRGAKAWCEAHPTEYKDVETIIFAYDTIHEGRFLGVNTKDLNNFVKADPTAVSLFYDAAKQLNVPIQKCSVPLGATDSAAFNQGGYKCVGITAMDHNLQSYYHTRLDSYDNLDPEGLANCFAVSVQALENFENGK